MVTDPEAEPVATPVALTPAMFESDDPHCTDPVMSLVVPSERWPVAVNCWFAPRPIDVEVGETWIEETVAVGLEPCVCEPPPPFAPQAVRIERTSTSAVQCTVFMNISGSKDCDGERSVGTVTEDLT